MLSALPSKADPPIWRFSGRRPYLVQGRVGIALRLGSAVDGTQAVQFSASSRELLAQFGYLVLQPALGGDQLGAALADGEPVTHKKWQEHLRPHRRDVFEATRSTRPWRLGARGAARPPSPSTRRPHRASLSSQRSRP